MSYDLSPRLVCSTTIGTSISSLFLSFVAFSFFRRCFFFSYFRILSDERHYLVLQKTCSEILQHTLLFQNVFEIVTIAWSGLGASLGPLMILRSYGKEIGRKTALIMMVSGVLMVLLWRYYFKLFGSLYEILPGLLVAFSIYFASLLIKKIRGE